MPYKPPVTVKTFYKYIFKKIKHSFKKKKNFIAKMKIYRVENKHNRKQYWLIKYYLIGPIIFVTRFPFKPVNAQQRYVNIFL